MASRRVTHRTFTHAASLRGDGRANIASHAHSRGEKIAGVLAGVVILGLVVVGLRYTVFTGPMTGPTSNGGGSIEREVAVDPFVQARMARVVVPTDDGRCREYPFYNDNGGFGPDRVILCDGDVPRASRIGPSAGFTSFKQAFGKK